jgi:hypothetical protein
MIWEKRVRYLSWVFFYLMWVAVIWYMVVSLGYEGIDDLRILPFFVFLALFLVLQVGAISVDRYEKEQVRRKGIPAHATIVSMAGTGRLIMNEPEYFFELDVQPPYEPRFVTTVEYVVPYAAVSRVQPGRNVQVRYIEGTKEVALTDL